MTDISVHNVIKSFEKGVNILDGLSFDITEGEHVGLLGKNGAGKTTLFRILCGEISEDEGEVVIARHKRVGLVSQIPVYPAGYTAEDVMKDAHGRIYAMRRRLDELERAMEQNASGAELREYDALSAEFTRLGGYELDRFRDTVANGLGIPRAMREQLFDSLSGGEKTRVNLARLILEDTDILLLDEPTNHLDMAACEWLEEYLAKFRGTVLVISHDRYFLDRAVTRIIEIQDGKAEFYSGAYSFYVGEKRRRYEEKLKKYEKDQAKIAQLTAAAEKMHLWAFMGNDKLHKRAFSMEKRIERLNATERPTTEKKLSARIEGKAFRGDEILTYKGLTKTYGGRTLFRDLEAQVRPGERIALIGQNGTGKTTLLRLLLGEEKADGGLIKRGPAVKTAYLPQTVTFEDEERTTLDTLVYELNVSPQTARNMLGGFQFPGDDVFKSVSMLSGGEKSRLKLCMLLHGEVNFLVLDEPTNHLDIASKEWMEEALEDYGEALLFVSHDRYFISRFATRIWELEDGTLHDFHGTFEQYRAYKAANAPQEAKAAPRETREEKPKQKKRSGSPEKLMAKAEREIAALEEKLRELDRKAEEHASDYEKLMEIEAEKETLRTELDGQYEVWEALAEESHGT